MVGEGRGLEERKRGLGRHRLWGRDSCEGILGLGQGPTGEHIHSIELRKVLQCVKGSPNASVTHHVGHVVDPRAPSVSSVTVFGDEVVFVRFHHASVHLLLHPLFRRAPPSAAEERIGERRKLLSAIR